MFRLFFRLLKALFRIITACCMLAVIPACEQTFLVDMDVPFQERILSTGFVVGGQGISLYVQLTQHPLSPRPDQELDVQLTLQNCMGDTLPLVRSGFNYYQTQEGFVPEPGQCFTLKVDYKPLGGVSNTQQVCVPYPVTLDSLTFTVDGKRNGTFYFHFTDPPGVNYYAIRLLRFDAEGNEIALWENKLLPETAFSDQVAINGQITAFTRASVITRNAEGTFFIDAVKAILYHLDEHTYHYLKSLQEAEGTLDDLWSEPTLIYSNMSNGVGLLGAFATDTLHMQLSLSTPDQ